MCTSNTTLTSRVVLREDGARQRAPADDDATIGLDASASGRAGEEPVRVADLAHERRGIGGLVDGVLDEPRRAGDRSRTGRSRS